MARSSEKRVDDGMRHGAADRTVKLILQGGHIIQLGNIPDIDSLVACLQESKGEEEVIEIRTEDADRLVVRRDALLAVFESRADCDDGNAYQTGSQISRTNPYVLLEDFLSPEDHRRVINQALQSEDRFQASKVTTGRDDYRKSFLLTEDDVIGPIFQGRIRGIVPDIAAAFGIGLKGELEDCQIECQVTAHRDCGFFHAHNDNGSLMTASRVLSYVYYFQSRPNVFFGGELKLYESQIRSSVELIGRSFRLVPPKNNSIVFFPSSLWHEVLPTYVPSGAFCDSRFTVNGWIKGSVA